MPHVVGMFGPVARGFRLTHEKSQLALALARAGVVTVRVGAGGLLGTEQASPYARTLPIPDGNPLDADVAVASAAARFLEEVAREPAPKPFFLECAFHLTARPFPQAAEDEDGHPRPAWRICRRRAPTFRRIGITSPF